MKLLILLLLPFFSFSQIKIVKDTSVVVKVRDWPHAKEKHIALVLSNGQIITQVNDLKLGKGSLPNGDFNFIATPSNSMQAKLKAGTMLKEIKIDEIKVKGNKKFGYSYIIICEGNYLVQLEDAVAAGEIIL